MIRARGGPRACFVSRPGGPGAAPLRERTLSKYSSREWRWTSTRSVSRICPLRGPAHSSRPRTPAVGIVTVAGGRLVCCHLSWSRRASRCVSCVAYPTRSILVLHGFASRTRPDSAHVSTLAVFSCNNQSKLSSRMPLVWSAATQGGGAHGAGSSLTYVPVAALPPNHRSS